MKEKKKRKEVIHKLRNKYRLVVLNDESFEEKASFKLSRLNVFVATSIGVILLVGATILLIALTPIREYIPGYSSSDLRKQAYLLSLQTDSLNQQLDQQEQYVENIQNILRGTPKDPVEHDVAEIATDPSEINLSSSDQEKKLREFVEDEERFDIPKNQSEKLNYAFFSPVKGLVSDGFNTTNKHFGVDITAPNNTPVKSCLDGIILFNEWTSETGYVVIIQHKNNLVSVYRHNSALLKKTNDFVQAGEAVAIIGNSGKQTTGPHLHFELWLNGTPINPESVISF